MDEVNACSSGKVNWGKIGVFRPKIREGTKVVESITHLYTGKLADIYAEGIDDSFDIEQNWQAKAAEFKRGTRKHSFLGFWAKNHHAVMLPWQGNSDGLCDLVSAAQTKIHAATTSTKVEEAHDKLMEESLKVRQLQACRFCHCHCLISP